jgi:hypothetical protein
MRIVSILCAFLLLAVFVAIPATGADNDPKLQSVTVTFHTRGEDVGGNGKRSDTTVDVYVNSKGDSDDATFAQAIHVAPDTQFDDPSDCGPYDLKIVRTVNKSEFLAGKTFLDIHPASTNKWIVRVEINAKFDDGTEVTVKSHKLVMAPGQYMQDFPNAGDN